MEKLCKAALIILTSATLFACAAVKLHQDNKPVRLFFSEFSFKPVLESGCEYRGFLVSSYGTWYNYLFISNESLTTNAVNGMYNRANEIGANAVYVRNIDFATSVTLVGQAFNCKELNGN